MRAHVVLVPLSTRLARAQRFAAAREAVAEALRASAELAAAPRALPCEAWPRLPSGAPTPVQGWHASFTDTTGLVAAAVAPVALGLDAEWLARPRWEAARARFAASGELALLGGAGRADVLALWCAKEALLKLAGVGLADLARCPLERRAGDELFLAHGGRSRRVRLHHTPTHVLAWVAAGPLELDWHVPAEVP
ncbi:MAG TPA: 4'-phosphopantetheinyl transferase superfamily protein [Planctomycetota bacterium]